MTDLISIGASALSAYRTALSTVSDNVANAQTPGYARRSTVIKEAPVASATSSAYNSFSTPSGSYAAGITRAWSDFKASESRVAASDASAADARMRWLTNTETALDDSDTGAGARVTAFFTAADSLASNPSSALGQQAMLSALDDATSAIRTSSDALARVSTGIASEAQTTVDSLNANLQTLASVNLALRRAGTDSNSHASLLDQRDQLIDTISAQASVTVTLDDSGVASLTLAGSTTKLLDNASPAYLTLQQASDGRLALSVSLPSGENVAANPTSGSLAGLVDVASTVATRRVQLNGIAADFTATVNGWQAQGKDASGNAGVPLLSLSGDAGTLRLATSDPTAIASASADGTANGNLLALQTLRDPGAESRLAALVASNAQMVASAKTAAQATATARDNAFADRDATSGVDLDQEAAELMRYQQAYSGSAKIVQVARETFQSLIAIF